MLYKRHVVSFRGLCVIFWRFIKWQLLFCTLIKFVCQYFRWQVKLETESPNISNYNFQKSCWTKFRVFIFVMETNFIYAVNGYNEFKLQNVNYLPLCVSRNKNMMCSNRICDSSCKGCTLCFACSCLHLDKWLRSLSHWVLR